MKIIALILSIGFIISGCNSKTSNSSNSIPDIMQPNWKGIEIAKLPIEFGQVIEIESNSVALKAIILDINKDEAGYWVGVCFIHKNKLFGRQILDMTNSTCLDLLDLTYIKNEILTDFKVIKSLTINKNKVGVGSNTPATNLKEIIRSFNWGIEQRKKKQTPCDKGLIDLNAVRECYFDIKKIQN